MVFLCLAEPSAAAIGPGVFAFFTKAADDPPNRALFYAELLMIENKVEQELHAGA